MTRTLTGDMQTAVAADTGTLFHLFKMEFSSGDVFLTTLSHGISWDGEDWVGLGGTLGFDTVRETFDEKGSDTVIEVSGVDQTIIALILADNTRGRLVTIWEAHINSAGAIVADPLELYIGYMNAGFSIQEDRDPGRAGTVQIRMPIVSRLSEIARVRGYKTNLISHQAVHDGDTFFQHVAQLPNRPIFWGHIPIRPWGSAINWQPGIGVVDWT